MAVGGLETSRWGDSFPGAGLEAIPMRPDVANQPKDGFCDSYRIGPRFTHRAHEDAFAQLSLEKIESRENLYRDEHPIS